MCPNMPEPDSTPSYLNRLSPERARALFDKVCRQLQNKNRYRDPDYSAPRLAADLGTNSRYISAAVYLQTGENLCTLVNKFRLKAACRYLTSSRYQTLTLEEVALQAGFSSRQVFHRVFKRAYGCTPKEFRSKAGHGK